jgi:hypothetical protein
MPTSYAILVPATLAWIALLGNHALAMRRDQRYRGSWGSLFWAFFPALLSAIYLTADRGVDMTVRNVVLGVLGGAVGAIGAIWFGYFANDYWAQAKVDVYEGKQNTPQSTQGPLVATNTNMPPLTTPTATAIDSERDRAIRAKLLYRMRNKFPDRVISEADPEYLMDLYKNKMTIVGDNAIAPFIGNWFLLSGSVSDVSGVGEHSKHGTLVTFRYEDYRLVQMFFDDTWNARLSVILPKEKIFALCQLVKASNLAAKFDPCELIDRD